MKANVQSIISSEEKADNVVQEIDEALNELDSIDEWLNHYTQMLDRMGADVQQVETRNKNLQVASANQKVLLTFMQDLTVTNKNDFYLNQRLNYLLRISFMKHLQMNHSNTVKAWHNAKLLSQN